MIERYRRRLVLFFGCWDEKGHALSFPSNGLGARDFESDNPAVPLDRTLLFLPQPERKGDGAITYIPATDRTILAWWGSPWDSRGGVNNAVIVSGEATAEEVWRAFVANYPALAGKLSMPNVIRGPSTTRLPSHTDDSL